mgnify:CR=1 FL=1
MHIFFHSKHLHIHRNYPVEIKVCLDSWKRIIPDYTIRLWNYDDAKQINNKYINEALNAHKWAFAADVVRFYAVYTEGGVYMDSDIFLKKRFDAFIPNKGFTAFIEAPNPTLPKFGLQAAFFMGYKGNSFCKAMLDYYSNHSFLHPDGTFDQTISPFIMAKVAEDKGFIYEDKDQQLDDDITIFSTKYLSPCNSYPHHPEAIGVHRIYGSWRKRKFGRKLEIKIKHIWNVIKYALLRK